MILERTGLRRACVAGGDTCGFAAKQLGIFALQMVIPVAPGAPLCRASSDAARLRRAGNLSEGRAKMARPNTSCRS